MLLVYFFVARFQWLSIWPCLDMGRSSSFDFLCVAPGHFFTTISFFEQPGDRHCTNIIECVVFSVRLSSDTPFFIRAFPQFGNYVRMTRAPSGEYNSPRKVLLSTSAFISLGVVMAASVEFCSNRLLTASVSNGGPLSCVPALVFSAVNSVSKTKKIRAFLSLFLSSGHL
jgi:hypothetical protein